jgi:hypothetical protein
MEYSGAGGKLIHEKTRVKKSRDTVPLSKLSKAQSGGKFRERHTYQHFNLSAI